MEKELLKGNYAIAKAAIKAGCDCYFGYPITPQTEIGEYLSEAMPKLGRGFVCAESELAAINMVLGAVATGKKAMTSSSSCAVALMQETLSYAASDELPVVLISVMRAGPGLGYIYPAQGDYNQAVVGGGNGDYRTIVLAAASVQDNIDFTYKAFYLAHKYRTPVIMLSDGFLGQMMEPAILYDYPYDEIDNSSWALTGANGRDARQIRSLEVDEAKLNIHINKLFEKNALIEQNEVMYEEENVDDADILLVAFGSMTRNIRAAMKHCREKGLKVGIFRPITLYPFPNKRLNELADKIDKMLVVEMNMGQMTKDVKLSVNGKAQVQHFGRPVGKWVGVEEIVDATLKFGGVKNATV